jgi:hypothetical protein
LPTGLDIDVSIHQLTVEEGQAEEALGDEGGQGNGQQGRDGVGIAAGHF